jgi:predicted aldo/keto reductase-like oxidoreductase
VRACSQNDIKEYECWRLFIRGQVSVAELNRMHNQALTAKAEESNQYGATIETLYKLVSKEGRWMLDIPSTQCVGCSTCTPAPPQLQQCTF